MATRSTSRSPFRTPVGATAGVVDYQASHASTRAVEAEAGSVYRNMVSSTHTDGDHHFTIDAAVFVALWQSVR